MVRSPNSVRSPPELVPKDKLPSKLVPPLMVSFWLDEPMEITEPEAMDKSPAMALGPTILTVVLPVTDTLFGYPAPEVADHSVLAA